MTDTVYRLAAFTDDPAGGNPAGVWIGNELPSAAEMQRIAAEVGYSETAFVTPRSGLSRIIRYYSPEAEVSFCGHATIATGVVLGRLDGAGEYRLDSQVGEVGLDVSQQNGRYTATLTSVATRHRQADPKLLESALRALRWSREELDASIPPTVAFAGAHHLVLASATRQRLDDLAYDFDALKALMLTHELTTLQLILRESETLFHARNPFPVGGVVEDPATGAAAAALGGYLRDAGLVRAPFRFTIRQGEAMGRPSLLEVQVPQAGGVAVTGTAVDIVAT